MADDGSDSLTGVPGSVLRSPSTSESQIETVGSSHFPPSERRLPLARVHNPGQAGNGSERVMSEREVAATGTNWGEAFLGLKALARGLKALSSSQLLTIKTEPPPHCRYLDVLSQ